MPEGAHQCRAALAAAKGFARGFAQLVHVFRAIVRQRVLFQVPPYVFGRIEFGCVRRQPCQGHFADGLLHPCLHFAAAVHGQAIPDNQQLSFDLGPQLPEELHRLRRFDRPLMHPEVKIRPRHPGYHREFSPVEGKLQLRGLPHRGPGAGDVGPLAQAALVDEDDGAVFPPGLFFNAGQVCRFQWAISFSSLWVARFSGRCTLQPIWPRIRQRCPG